MNEELIKQRYEKLKLEKEQQQKEYVIANESEANMEIFQKALKILQKYKMKEMLMFLSSLNLSGDRKKQAVNWLESCKNQTEQNVNSTTYFTTSHE